MGFKFDRVSDTFSSRTSSKNQGGNSLGVIKRIYLYKDNSKDSLLVCPLGSVSGGTVYSKWSSTSRCIIKRGTESETR